MKVHVKTPHTEIDIKGEISEKLLNILRAEYGDALDISEDEYINPFESDWYNQIKEQMTPGDVLKIDRENMGITQQVLGNKLGNFSRQYISDLEHGRKNISLQVAKKLAVIFDNNADRYI